MKNLLSTIFIFLILVLGIIFLAIILTLLFIGSGYIISLLFNFTLLNATALCIGVALVSSFIAFIAIYSGYKDREKTHYVRGNEDCDCPVCTFLRERLEDKKLRRYKSR